MGGLTVRWMGAEMNREQDKVIRYKWNPRTESGFRLRFDQRRANIGGLRYYRVEDWTDHRVVDEWGCSSLDEALGVLSDFVDIDVGQERHLIAERL